MKRLSLPADLWVLSPFVGSVGEESGGGGTVIDCSREYTLTNTRLRLHYAMMVFESAISGFPEGRGIIPDSEVEYSLQDYLDENDAQMQKVIEIIRTSGGR